MYRLAVSNGAAGNVVEREEMARHYLGFLVAHHRLLLLLLKQTSSSLHVKRSVMLSLLYRCILHYQTRRLERLLEYMIARDSAGAIIVVLSGSCAHEQRLGNTGSGLLLSSDLTQIISARTKD